TGHRLEPDLREEHRSAVARNQAGDAGSGNRRGVSECMDFKLPELGEGVYEAELVSWLVKPGDTGRRGQNLMGVLTDKATMEVPAPFAGTVQKLAAEPGQQIKVGDVVLTYQEAGKAEEPGRKEEDGARKPATKTVAVARANGPSRSEGIPVRAAPSVR